MITSAQNHGLQLPIYMDYNATTPLDPQVREEFISALGVFGNPSSLHAQGQAARALIDKARARVAKLIGEFEFAAAAQVLVDFLKTVNPQDWRIPVFYWPRVDG